MDKRFCFPLMVLLLIAILIAPLSRAWAQRGGERIKISYTARALDLLPLFLGVHFGIYEKEGFQVDLVQMSGGAVIPAALMHGDLDYSTSADVARVAGLPIRILAAMQVKTSLSLVVSPEIKEGSDLRGKAIAISRTGSFTDHVAREFARYYGLNPEKGEVTTLGVGSHSARLLALQQNRVQGAILGTPGDTEAVSLGFKILSLSSDVLPDTLLNGFTASVAKIRENRAQVKRALRAFVNSQIATVDKPDVVIPFVMSYWKLDRASAETAYKNISKTFPRTGSPTKQSLTNAINEAIRTTKGSRTISEGDVIDLQLLNEVQRELGLQK
jgi:NitT/TauT family transport system substrate-binding protein